MRFKVLGTGIIVFVLFVGTSVILYLGYWILYFPVPSNLLWVLLFAIVLMLFLTIVSFNYGRKLIRSNKETLFDSAGENAPTDKIHVKINIQKKEYLKLSYTLSYQSPMILFITICGLLMLGFFIEYFAFPQVGESFPFLPLVIFIYSLVFVPISVYYSSIKNMKNMSLLKETVYYTFSVEDIHINCESMDTNLKWNVIKSIKELNHWYILFVGQNRGYFIPKSQFSSGLDETNFRCLLLSKVDIKKDLK